MECNTLFDSSALKGFCIYPTYLPLQGTSISNGSTSRQAAEAKLARPAENSLGGLVG